MGLGLGSFFSPGRVRVRVKGKVRVRVRSAFLPRKPFDGVRLRVSVTVAFPPG